jgi:hypothetical protein
MSEQSFNDAKNTVERATERKFPGYTGLNWGEFTPGKEHLEMPDRTQIGFSDGSTYWLDVPHNSIIGGDQVMIVERERPLIVTSSGMTMPHEYFDTKDAIPHRFGTFVQLIRKGHSNGKGADREDYR